MPPPAGNKFAAHRGVPIGVVRIEPKYLQFFRNLIDDTLKIKARFRGVDMGRKADDERILLTVHLPPVVCAALDSGNSELADYLESVGAEYVAGVRRSRSTALRESRQSKGKKRKLPHASIPPQAPQQKHEGKTSSFTFVELFAGIGGFRIGLEHIGGKCILSSEINEYSADIYETRFGKSDALEVGDILDLESSAAGKFTMLTAGFPCQSFSNRGGQKGLDDDRGQMYRECARLLYAQRPECFLFENVAGLVALGGGSRPSRERGERGASNFVAGRILKRILHSFEACGYCVEWKVINSRHWVPQNRERIYIVGTRIDLNCDLMNWDNVLADGSGLYKTVRDIMEDADSAWSKRSELSEAKWAKVKSIHRNKSTDPYKEGRIDIDGKSPTIITNYHRVTNFSSRFVFEQSDGTVCDGRDDNRRPRFLTPRECATIMGFPADFYCPSAAEGEDNVSHYYQAIGNAVTPPVISAIGKELLRCIQTTKGVVSVD